MVAVVRLNKVYILCDWSKLQWPGKVRMIEYVACEAVVVVGC